VTTIHDTFYVCQACRHPAQFHGKVGSRPCGNTYPEECTCSAYQAPRWDNDVQRAVDDLADAGHNLARLAGRLDDPVDLAQFFAELAEWVVQSRLHQAGKSNWVEDPAALRRAATELLEGALAEARADTDSASVPVKGEFLLEYIDTVLARK
jgi:hypothetical protein